MAGAPSLAGDTRRSGGTHGSGKRNPPAIAAIPCRAWYLCSFSVLKYGRSIPEDHPTPGRSLFPVLALCSVTSDIPHWHRDFNCGEQLHRLLGSAESIKALHGLVDPRPQSENVIANF